MKKYFAGLLAALARPASGADSHLASSEKACRDGLRLPALVESLETRLLYSADLAPVALANQDAPVVTQQAQAPTPIQSQSIELVVLDSRVADPTVLLQDILQQQTAGRAIRVLEVSAEEDAFLSIGGVLDELHSQGIEVSAIHIVSHGRDGAFDLGNQTVDEAFLRSQPLAFAAWAQSLSENADLLVYGCNFAQSESGQSLSRNLAALTGADVAGNLQETGSLALGGDWTLDFATGVVESSTLFSAQAQSGWNFLLLSGVSSPSVVHGLTTADMTTGSVDDTLNRTGGSAIAMDNAGNYVVVWTDATNNQILLRRFSANGTALSAMQALSGVNSQVNPSVAMAADGSFVVVWSEKLSGRLAVVGQRVNADGTANGGNFLVASAAGVDCLKADVAINDDKDFVVVWQRLNAATSYDVYSQSFRWASSVGGLPIEITGELTIGASPLGVITGSEQRPVVAINGNRVFVAWEGADAVGTGILMRAVNLDGTQATASVLVNVNGDYRESAPDIAVAPDGRVIVVWQVDSPIANSDVIRFRIFEESGSGVGGLVAVTGDRTPNLTPGNDQLLPKVAVSPNGEFVITYQGFNQTINRTDASTVVDPQWGVFIRHFDRLGNEVEAEQSVPDTGLSVSDMTLNQFAANVAWRGGQAAVAWTADGLIFSGGNVVARRFGVGVPSIIVTPPDVSTVNVGGTGREISVVLATQPTSDVTLNVSSTNGFGSVDKSTLVFTASNWYLPQKLLVTAVGVSGQNPLESFFVRIAPAVANPPAYAGLPTRLIGFTNSNVQVHAIVVDTDNDVADAPSDSTLADLLLYKGADGVVSLREALRAANLTVNANATANDEITFNIPGAFGDVHIIQATSALPQITDAVTINGLTQAGASAGDPKVLLDGAGAAYEGLLLIGAFGTGLGFSSGSVVTGFGVQNFGLAGIEVHSGYNQLVGNVIKGNHLAGIHIWSPGTTSASSNVIDRNVVTDNGYAGIHLDGSDNNDVSNNVVLRNYLNGLYISNASGGGATSNNIFANFIGGNGKNGIHVAGSPTSYNAIYNNHIGLDGAGTVYGNGENGVLVSDGASNNIIGGTQPAKANVIANSGLAGVRVVDGVANSVSNRILGNSIYGNGSLGIDLTAYDVGLGAFPVPTHNVNDLADPFFGPNGSINSPVITSVISSTTDTTVRGTISASPNSFYRIEFFASPQANLSGYGDGTNYLGFLNVATDAAGLATFAVSFPAAIGVGNVVSATLTRASDITYTLLSDTSEFSNAQVVKPELEFSTTSVTRFVYENASPLLINFKSLLSDPSATGVTFELGVDPDAPLFSIDPVTGLLAITPANYESLPNDPGGAGDHNRAVTVIASDGLKTVSISLLVYYLDVNEQGAITGPGNFTIQEDSQVSFTGSNLSTLSDPDEGTTPGIVPPVTITPVSFGIKAKLLNGVATGQFTFNNLPLALASELNIVDLGNEIQLTGTLANVNLAIPYLVFTPTLNDTRTISLTYSMDDNGSGASLGAPLGALKTIQISVTPVNDPTILNFPSVQRTIASGASIQLGNTINPTLLMTDIDSGTNNIQLNVSVAQGELSINTIPGVTIITAANGVTVLVLEGQLANLEKALNSIVYTASLGAAGLVPISVRVVDPGSLASGSAVTVTGLINLYINSAPVVLDGDFSISFIEGSTNPLSVFASAILYDSDAPVLQSMRISYVAPLLPDESVVLPDTSTSATVSQSYDVNTGVITLTGAASLAEYQTYARQFAYMNSAVKPNATPRVFSISVFDGLNWSSVAQTSVTTIAVNTVPSITMPTSFSVAFGQEINLAAQGGGVVPAISDVDAGNSTLEFIVQAANGTIRFNNTQGLVVVGNAAGSSSLKISGSLAQLNNALSQLFYRANSGFVGNDTINFTIDDFGGVGLPAGQSIGQSSSAVIALAGIPPAVAIGPESIVFIENAGPILALPTVTLSGSNQGVLVSAVVTIVGGYQPGIDILSAPSGVWNAATGELRINGSLTLLDYQTLLRKLTFDNTSDSPDTGKRELTVVLFDGLESSAVESMFFEVVAINDAPLLSQPNSISVQEDTRLLLSSMMPGNYSDADSAALTLSVQAAHGSFSWNGVGTQPSGIDLQTSGLVRFTGSVVDINTWSNQLVFTPDLNFNGVVNIDWRLNDNEATPLSAVRQSQLTVNPVNDSPAWLGSSTPVVNQGESIVIGQANSKATDVEDSSIALTYKIVALPQHGVLTLNGQPLTLADSFTQADIDGARISYRNDGGVATIDLVKFEVSDSQGAKTATQTLALSVSLRPVLVITTPPTQTPNPVSSPPAATVIATGGIDVKDVASGGAGGAVGVSNTGAVSIANTTSSNSPRAQSRSNTSAAASVNNSSNDVSGTSQSGSNSQQVGSQVSTAAFERGAKVDNASAVRSAGRLEGGSVNGFMRVKTDAENVQYSGLIRAALQDKSFFDDVQKTRDESNQSIKFDRNVVATSSALSASLSIGYVIWLVRGGALMSSLLASIPAWRMMDPLPILGSMGGNGSDQDDEDESLGSMIDKAKAKKMASQAELAQTAAAI